MRILLIFLMFLFIGALVIVSNGNLHLKDGAESKKFVDLYYSWLINTGSNMFKATAYVVKFEWMPNSDNTAIQNISNSTK